MSVTSYQNSIHKIILFRRGRRRIIILNEIIRYIFFQLQDFIVKYPYMGTGSRAFEQAIEKTQRNMKWMTQNIDSITNWLSTVTKVATKQRVKDVRLPLHLVPTTYDLTLKPNMYSDDPKSFTFDGYIKIHMNAEFTGSNVTVHTNKLTIDDSTIQFGKEDGSAGPLYTGKAFLLKTHYMSRDMWFPTMWHFDKCRLRPACAASF